MRIESLPPIAQSRSARPAQPEPARPGPSVAQASPPANVSAALAIEKAAPATLSGLLAIQEDARGPGPRSETKSPAQQIRASEPNLAGRAFGAAVSALASGREVVAMPPAEENSESVVEAALPENNGTMPINVEPEATLVEKLLAADEEPLLETSL